MFHNDFDIIKGQKDILPVEKLIGESYSLTLDCSTIDIWFGTGKSESIAGSRLSEKSVDQIERG
ncbi:hypothetical protein FG05_35180 [Fusarium graminearum]|nr:hypothetical protein FG05_35180 [Fusarium graminearum]